MTERAIHPDEVFNAARRISNPQARRAYLERACGENSSLRAKVESLLEAHEQAGSFLDAPAADLGLGATVDRAELEEPGTVIGRYKLLERIGEGGFGVVYMAEQQHPVRRKVALKVIKPGFDTRQVIARFEAERQALALMDHENIAKVLDAGATDAGRPYFVMELVHGVPITEYCDRNQLPSRERLELFVQVCRAVQHAHTKGVIHRDIKPTNVLVTLHEGVAVPKVIDFGIAKATGQQLTDKTLFTNFAQMVGTPLYMSPEQAEMTGIDVDTRSDVYSLGVLLYELLTGTTPLDKERLKQAAFDEVRRLIREEEPPRPSTRISTMGEQARTISARRRSDPRRLGQLVRRELDWIVMKALEKDRNRRYETANGLAADVQRHLAGEAVQAVPPSAVYRLSKFARKNKGPMAAAGLVVLTLLAGIIGTTWQAVRADQRAEGERQAKDAKELARQKAEQERKYAQAIADFVNKDFLALTTLEGQERFGGTVSAHLSKDTTLRQLLDRAAAKLNERTDLEPRIEAELRWMIGMSYREQGEPHLAIPFLERCVTLRKQWLGPDDPETLDAQNSLGVAFQGDGEIDLALALLEETWMRRKAKLGARHPDTLLSMNNLAASYHAAGKPTARKFAEETIILVREELGLTVFMLRCVNVLAAILIDEGKFDQALPLLEENLGLLKANVGPDHPETLSCMNHLAGCHIEAGKPDMAARLLEASLELSRAKLGVDHPTTLLTMSSLAAVYHDTGSFDLAMPLIEEGLKLLNAKGWERSPTHLVTLHNLATAYRYSGKLTESARLLERISQVNEKKLGSEHPQTLKTLNSLAVAYEALGRPADAIRLLVQVRRAWEKRLGPDHPSGLTALRNLAVTHMNAGNMPEAVRLYEQFKAGLEKVHGAGHLVSLAAASDLGAAYRAAGKVPEALKLLEHAASALQEKLDGHRPETLRAQNHLARAYLDAGKLADALRLYEHIRKVREEHLGPDNPATLEAVHELAQARQTAGESAEAIRLYELALAGRERVLEPGHPKTLHTVRGLAFAYLADARAGEAIGLLRRLSQAQKKGLGPDNRETLLTLEVLAGAYKAAGQLQESIDLYTEVASVWEAKYGREDRNTIMILNNLAHSYWSAKRLDRSIPIFEDVVKRSEATLGPDHAETVVARANLGVNYRDAGQLDKALPLLEEAYQKGKAHAALAWVGEAVVTAYIKANKPGPAAALLHDHLLSVRQRLAADSPQFAVQLALAGSHFLELKLHAEAEPVLRECLGIRERHAPDDWKTFNTRSMLGEALLGQKKYGDAGLPLLEGYAGMKQRAGQIPQNARFRLPQAAARLVRFYEATGNDGEVEKWRQEVDAQTKVTDGAAPDPR